MSRDLETAVAPVATALGALAVDYYLAGSVISSLFGVARATADVDLVAALRREHARPLVQALGDSYYARSALGRRQRDTIVAESPAREFAIASAEDVVLHKLRWFRDGGELSDRQWGDILGVLRVQRTLDLSFMRTWATDLGVTDLLERALEEASLPPRAR